MQPLVNDQKIHISKHSEEEGQHRQGLNKNMHLLIVVPIIKTLDHYSQCHMQQRYNYCYLHLQTVGKVQIVVGDGPNRVDSDWIYAVVFQCGNSIAYLVAAAENVETQGEVFVINPSTVECEETHQDYRVSMRAKHVNYRIAEGFRKDEEQAKGEQGESMSDIPKHYSEHKWESNQVKHCRICLLIMRCAISAQDLIWSLCYCVEVKQCWLILRFDGNELRRRHLVISQSLMQFSCHSLNVLRLDEDESFIKIVMQFHLIQLLVDLLLMQEIETIIFKFPQ